MLAFSAGLISDCQIDLHYGLTHDGQALQSKPMKIRASEPIDHDVFYVFSCFWSKFHITLRILSILMLLVGIGRLFEVNPHEIVHSKLH